MPNYPYALRDAQGYRIPREGTLSYDIYVLLKQGLSRGQLAEKLGVPASMVGVIANRIRHPDVANAYARKLAKRKREAV